MKLISLTKTAIAIGLVVAFAALSTASATHVFTDVDDNRFFADAVEWASTNGITTGTSPTTFEPDRNVTRGESVTFLNRYDENLVQPALDDRYTKAESDAAHDDLVTIAALDAGLVAVADAASDQFGGMNLLAIDVAIDKAETADIATVDGVTITATCADDAGATNFLISVTSDTDGWYFPATDGTALLAVDLRVRLDVSSVAAGEVTSYQIDGFPVRTPNGGYMAIDGETAMWVLNSTVEPFDCIYQGIVRRGNPASASLTAR